MQPYYADPDAKRAICPHCGVTNTCKTVIGARSRNDAGQLIEGSAPAALGLFCPACNKSWPWPVKEAVTISEYEERLHHEAMAQRSAALPRVGATRAVADVTPETSPQATPTPLLAGNKPRRRSMSPMEIQRALVLQHEGYGFRAIAAVLKAETGIDISHMTVKRGIIQKDRG